MTEIAGRRMRAEIDGDFVVFLLGARFHSKLHLYRTFLDLGGRRGMVHMLQYLMAHPEKGLLGFQQLGLVTVAQYWRSFDHLEAFARDEDDPHLAVWRTYWKPGGRIRGHLRQHAAVRPGAGGTPGASRGVLLGPQPPTLHRALSSNRRTTAPGAGAP